ncbi:hypothetical protein A3758_13790 [Oleiphilus sp. HI0118]|nr:hypothetical protein A3758_15340 [Oleiphilus sp. HI0118]KZZ48346.1 hypothetical protein A3758_13790 [Oleiphilus sp. HI0118]
MKLGIIITVSCLLSGCASLFPIQVTDPRTGIEYTVPARLQDVPGIKELAEACATKAGRVVHRTVEVDGYFDESLDKCESNCWHYLSWSKFRYLELEVRETNSSNHIKDKGFWRITKYPLGDNKCDQKILNRIEKFSNHAPRKIDSCLGAESIDEPKSLYAYRSWIEIQKLSDQYESELMKGVRTVENIAGDRELLAQQVTFTLFSRSSERGTARQLVCESLSINHTVGRFKDVVLKPVN